MSLNDSVYLSLVLKCLTQGQKRPNRTGVDTLSLFGEKQEYTLENNTIPLLTTKQMNFSSIVEELLFFIRGCTDTKKLKTKIWNAHSSRQFLDSKGFNERREGDLGPMYGFQWRHFGAEYIDCDTDYTKQGIDQLNNILFQLKNTPNDRAIILSAWNPKDIQKMNLPPCHCFVQFLVLNGNLTTILYQRSADLGLGVPYNIASYAILSHLLALMADLKATKLIHIMGDVHIYENHIKPLKQQYERFADMKPQTPRLKISRKCNSFEEYLQTDFIVEDYDPMGPIKMDLAI